MIVECESCATRFNLADAQVPPQGARVRCSKCHHRFHVMPAAQAPEPSGSPVAAAETPTPTPDRDADDPDLDNPEFLFEGSSSGAEPSPEAGGPEEPGRPEEPGEPSAPGEPTASGPSAPGPSEPSAAGDLGHPGEDEGPFPPSAEPREVRREVFGFGEAKELTSDPEEQAGQSAAEAGATPADEPPRDAPTDSPAAGGRDDPDDLLADLDGDDSQVEIDAWGDAEGPEPDLAPPPPTAPAKVRSRPAPQVAPRAPAAAAPTSAEMDSMISRMAGGAVRMAAWVVGLALIAGGVRVLVGHGVGPPPGPDSVRAHGWTASEIEARYLRDPAGRRVLVVQGDLESGGTGPAPRVRASLLDAQGRVVLESDDALHDRLDAGALARALAPSGAAPAAQSAPGSLPPGFTLIVPEPPPSARRFRLALLPGGGGS